MVSCPEKGITMKFTRSAIFLVLALSCVCRAVEPGDRAPDLMATTWINGPAVNPAEPDGKTTYVIEFWATWCPPCKRSIPRLNQLHDQFEDKNVVVIGVTGEAEETVRPFVENMGMKYLVVVDTNHAYADTYMEGVPGIPHAFIVDTNGILVWDGHPMDGLEDILSQVLAGTYDMITAKEAQGEDVELQKLLTEGDYDKALSTLDKLISKEPNSFEYYELKIGLLAQLGKTQQAKGLYKEIFETFKDSAEDLNTLAWMAVTSPFELCDLHLAWKAAERAADLSKRENSAILDTLARIYYSAGLLEQSAKTQEEAIEKCPEGEERDSLKATLDFYESALALRNQMKKSAVK